VSKNLDRVTALVRELADLVSRTAIERLAVPPEVAAELGLETAQAFCTEYGGQVIYIPAGFAVRINQRDREMFDLFVSSGRNINAVTKKFGCSIHTAYRRIKLVEAAQYAERQPNLFDDPP
jgi:Mor family transcriptional regulator